MPRMDDDIGDDLLRLIFMACHPVLSTEARVALTLRLLGGLTTEEIARAFLVARADDRPAHRPRQADAGRRRMCRSRCPRGAERAERLASVLEVLYLVFNEGYSATAGGRLDAADALRRGAAAGPRAGRAGAGRARGPRPGGVDGMQSSRLRARVGPGGEADAAARSEPRALGSAADWSRPRGARAGGATDGANRASITFKRRSLRAMRAPPFRRRRTGQRIARLYAQLVAVTGSPIVRLNHAVAVGDGRRTGGGTGSGGSVDGGRRAGRTITSSERARRPPGKARPASPKRGPSSSGPPD